MSFVGERAALAAGPGTQAIQQRSAQPGRRGAMGAPAPSHTLRLKARAQGMASCPQAQTGPRRLPEQPPHGQTRMLAAQRAVQGPSPRTAAAAVLGAPLQALSMCRRSEQAASCVQLRRQQAGPAGKPAGVALWVRQ